MTQASLRPNKCPNCNAIQPAIEDAESKRTIERQHAELQSLRTRVVELTSHSERYEAQEAEIRTTLTARANNAERSAAEADRRARSATAELQALRNALGDMVGRLQVEAQTSDEPQAGPLGDTDG